MKINFPFSWNNFHVCKKWIISAVSLRWDSLHRWTRGEGVAPPSGGSYQHPPLWDGEKKLGLRTTDLTFCLVDSSIWNLCFQNGLIAVSLYVEIKATFWNPNFEEMFFVLSTYTILFMITWALWKMWRFWRLAQTAVKHKIFERKNKSAFRCKPLVDISRTHNVFKRTISNDNQDTTTTQQEKRHFVKQFPLLSYKENLP